LNIETSNEDNLRNQNNKVNDDINNKKLGGFNESNMVEG
jgi:hypothetical protein